MTDNIDRLNTYPEDWHTVVLGEVATTYNGLSGKSGKDFGHGSGRYVPFVNVMANTRLDPHWSELVDVSKSEGQNLVKVGDVLFNTSSETPEEVALGSAVTEDIGDVYLNSFCFGLRIHSPEELDAVYLAYFSRSVEGRRLIAPLAQGSTRFNIGKKAFLQLALPVPPISEQRKIAEALSDADLEVQALEGLVAKKRNLKTGMAQQLLSGKMRLL